MGVQAEGVSELRSALAQRFPTAFKPRVIEGRPPTAQTIEPRRVTEVVGPPGAGGCSLVLRHMAELLGEGDRYAAYIDLTGELYPPAAAQLGVPLDRLLLVRPGGLATALRVAEVLLRGGATYLVVLDIAPGTPVLRLSTYHRLRRRVIDSRAALVVLAREPVLPADHRIWLSR